MLNVTFWKEQKGWFYKIVGQPTIYGSFETKELAEQHYLLGSISNATNNSRKSFF